MTMTSLLPLPELQLFDMNGVQLSGGSIATYSPGTLENKTCWADAGQVEALTNPIILSSSGSAIIYGDGDYRWIVSDSLGNEIYDALTSATLPEDAISAAMLPVVGAATTATAITLLGIPAYIASIVDAIMLMTGPTGPAGPTGPVGPIGSTGATSGYNPSLIGGDPGQISFPDVNGSNPGLNFMIQAGHGTTSGGAGSVAFAAPFPTGCLAVVLSSEDQNYAAIVSSSNAAGFTVISTSPLTGGSWVGGNVTFAFIAVGY